jgi:ethanolamine kinase
MREPGIAAEIAKQLRRFHQLDIPGSKEPQLWNDVFKFLKKGNGPNFILDVDFGSSCFHFIHILRMALHNIVCFKILIAASVLKFEDNEKQKRYETISFREIQDEVKELKVPYGSNRITVMSY